MTEADLLRARIIELNAQLELCESSQRALLHEVRRVKRISASRMRRLRETRGRLAEAELRIAYMTRPPDASVEAKRERYRRVYLGES